MYICTLILLSKISNFKYYTTTMFTKKTILLFVLPIILTSCHQKNAKVALEKPVISLKLTRFDQKFYQSSQQDLQELKNEFPYFFAPDTPDTVWYNKLKNPLLRSLYNEVQAKFPHFESQKRNFEDFLENIQNNFPNQKIPHHLITLISEVDVASKVIYTDSLMLVSLDTYLGANHRFYQDFPKYLRQNLAPNQILPDMAMSFLEKNMVPPTDKTFLSAIIYYGKMMYIAEQLLPKVTKSDIMSYTPAQYNWCEINETEIWKFFVQEKLLFSTDAKLIPRFIAPAPFSKFYTSNESESPGRVGVWVGKKIVTAFMKNNDAVSLPELIKLDAKTIFEKSNYKPKK